LTSDEDVENKSLQDIKKDVLNSLKDIYPGKNISITNIIRTQWGSDPYSYGSYSSYGVGSSPQDIDNLVKAEGRIYFAGEHTNRKYQPTVHGAYLSAIDVVNSMDSRFLDISYFIYIYFCCCFK